ncbi:MAG: zinc ribbon domain-containing protein [Caldilineaceae bacterium]
MSEVQRICTQCGQAGPLNARYCAHCGYDTEGALPVQRQNLPAVVVRAALPILAGAASLALRAGWKLLQNRLTTAAAESTSTALRTTPAPAAAPAKSRRTIHIRSAWAVGDANGNWRRGESEHVIEIDD